MTTEIKIEEPFGPIYPALAAVKKFRNSKDRKAYGSAVLMAIAALQRSELQRELPTHNVDCASGTNHTDGDAIIKAMRTKHRAALAACAAKVRRDRTTDEWESMYAAAMADKAKRATSSAPLALAA